jgi:large subunit ribosomal protein L19
LIIRVKNPNLHTWTFTVRGKVLWIDVEKTYPLSYDKIEKIILLDEKKVRRAKLYFIRNKVWKAARLKSLLQGERSSERGKLIGKRKIEA